MWGGEFGTISGRWGGGRAAGFGGFGFREGGMEINQSNNQPNVMLRRLQESRRKKLVFFFETRSGLFHHGMGITKPWKEIIFAAKSD